MANTEANPRFNKRKLLIFKKYDEYRKRVEDIERSKRTIAQNIFALDDAEIKTYDDAIKYLKDNTYKSAINEVEGRLAGDYQLYKNTVKPTPVATGTPVAPAKSAAEATATTVGAPVAPAKSAAEATATTVGAPVAPAKNANIKGSPSNDAMGEYIRIQYILSKLPDKKRAIYSNLVEKLYSPLIESFNKEKTLGDVLGNQLPEEWKTYSDVPFNKFMDLYPKLKENQNERRTVGDVFGDKIPEIFKDYQPDILFNDAVQDIKLKVQRDEKIDKNNKDLFKLVLDAVIELNKGR